MTETSDNANSTSQAVLRVRGADQELEYTGSAEEVGAELRRLVDKMLERGDLNVLEVKATRETAPVVLTLHSAPETDANADGDDDGESFDDVWKEHRADGREDVAAVLEGVTFHPRQLTPLFSATLEGVRLAVALPDLAARDFLLLLAYGALVVDGVYPMGARRLTITMAAAKRKIGHKARLLADVPDLVTLGGRGAGRTYALTGEGVRHCEALIRRLLGELGGPGSPT